MTSRRYGRIASAALILAAAVAPTSAGSNGSGRTVPGRTDHTVQEVHWQGRSHSARETAISYLAEEAGQRGRSQGEFIVTGTAAVPGGVHVRVLNTYAGIPIFRSTTVISINDRNQVTMIAKGSSHDIVLSVLTPSFDPAEAGVIARNHLNPAGPVINESAASLVIYASESGVSTLAYHTSIVCENPIGDWEILIDARSGELILMEDRFVQYGRANGSGYVFLPDPVSVAGGFYGEKGFEDNNDATTDSLDHHRSLVMLDSLLVTEGTFALQSPWFTIRDIESPYETESYTAPTADGFRFNRSQPGFEAVNIYYHASQAYHYVHSLGFNIPSLKGLQIDPHGYQGTDNSHYSPSGNWMSFGEGGVDDAEDAQVIWHEYAHAIQYNINPVWGGGESLALGEGFGDYWAASYTRSLGLWNEQDEEHNWLFLWDGHNAFWDGRIMNDNRTYPFGNISSHEAGQIWASALMGIWGDLGKEVTDRLVMKSQYYLSYGVTARDAATAILQADRDLYSGEHLSVLVYWLGTVKKFFDPSNELPTIRHTPLADTRNTDGPYQISATITPGRSAGLSSVALCWRIDGVMVDTTIMTADQDNRFIAEIPGSGTEGLYEYFIVATDRDGSVSFAPYAAPAQLYSFSVGGTNADGAPERFELSQNFPNPFNPSTSISIDLAEDAVVVLRIYDLLGREVAVLLDGMQPAGHRQITWNPQNSHGVQLPTGPYLYRMDVVLISDGSRFSQTRKMLYLR